MPRSNLYRVFLGYVSFVLLCTFLLGFRVITDLSDCNSNPKQQQAHPHDSGDNPFDPWNVNDHPVTFPHSEVADKKKRDLHRSQLQPPLVSNQGQQSNKGRQFHDVKLKEKSDFTRSDDNENDQIVYSPHHLAVIVPFRDRFEELQDFVPHMHKYLKEKGIAHTIYIVNQADKHRFNRASLINVGFLAARNESHDYIVMHDVDLLPLNKNLNYGYPDNGPFHVAAPHLHPKYHYPKFVGGILVLSVEQFEQVNGLSNKFWGWGREDDELYMRMTEAGYVIQRHGMEIETGYNTFKHEHDSEKRPRDYRRLFGQKKASFKRDYETGFHNVEYKILARHKLTVDGNPCILLDVSLLCDKMVTPWCDFPSRKHR